MVLVNIFVSPAFNCRPLLKMGGRQARTIKFAAQKAKFDFMQAVGLPTSGA
jgi:hypothetical protein